MHVSRIFTAAASSALTAGALFLAPTLADAEVITFSDLTQPGTFVTLVGSAVTEGDVVFTATNESALYSPQSGSYGLVDQTDYWYGQSSLVNANYAGETVVTMANGNTFNFNSIELAPLGSDTAQSGATTIFATNGDGLTVSEVATFGPTFTLNKFTAFDNVRSVTIVQAPSGELDPFQFTDVTINAVSAVPEPGTLPLLAVGVAAVALAARRRSSLQLG